MVIKHSITSLIINISLDVTICLFLQDDFISFVS